MMNEDYLSAEKRYARHSSRSSSVHTRRSINGAAVGSSKCVAFCRFGGHPGFLTEKQRREHGCLEKGCLYYLAKPGKQKEKAASCDQSPAVLRFLQDALDTEDGVKVIRVECERLRSYKAYFITITEEYSFDACREKAGSSFSANIEFIRLNYDFDTCLALLFQ